MKTSCYKFNISFQKSFERKLFEQGTFFNLALPLFDVCQRAAVIGKNKEQQYQLDFMEVNAVAAVVPQQSCLSKIQWQLLCDVLCLISSTADVKKSGRVNLKIWPSSNISALPFIPQYENRSQNSLPTMNHTCLGYGNF